MAIPLTEQDFLREKTRTVYESERTVTDSATGEILRQEKEVSKRTSSEPDFIKVYYKAMMAVQGVEDLPLKFLLALSCEIGFSNGDRVIFYNNKMTRQSIAKYCAVSDNMVSKYIKQAVNKGVLFPTEYKGAYEVNPWLIAKGKWEHIRELQASFQFVAGRWQRVAMIDDVTDEQPQAAARSPRAELEGQLSFADICPAEIAAAQASNRSASL